MQSKIFTGPARFDEFEAWKAAKSITPLGIFCQTDRSLEIQYEPPDEPLTDLGKVLALVPRKTCSVESGPLVMPYGHKHKVASIP